MFVCEMDKLPLLGEEHLMKRLSAEDRLPEIKCSACGGTGFPKVKQPVQPGRRIFPAPCSWCLGKGRLTVAAK